VAHYPPYCSKWNSIEHRLFPHVHHAWEGAVFQNIQIVKELTHNISTKTGLEVKVRINDKKYETKRIVETDFKSNLNDFVSFDPVLPQWNDKFLVKNRELIF
jgi:hypothetical protein